MAAHPLRPATDRCLGRLLPHQLTNRTRAPLLAINISHLRAHWVLAAISHCCPHPKGRFSRVTHPSATKFLKTSFDLHVLGIPPAFILSQDQTLHVELSFNHLKLISSYVYFDHSSFWATIKISDNLNSCFDWGWIFCFFYPKSSVLKKTVKLLYCLGSVRFERSIFSQPRIYQYRQVNSKSQPFLTIILESVF